MYWLLLQIDLGCAIEGVFILVVQLLVARLALLLLHLIALAPGIHLHPIVVVPLDTYTILKISVQAVWNRASVILVSLGLSRPVLVVLRVARNAQGLARMVVLNHVCVATRSVLGLQGQ